MFPIDFMANCGSYSSIEIYNASKNLQVPCHIIFLYPIAILKDKDYYSVLLLCHSRGVFPSLVKRLSCKGDCYLSTDTKLVCHMQVAVTALFFQTSSIDSYAFQLELSCAVGTRALLLFSLFYLIVFPITVFHVHEFFFVCLLCFALFLFISSTNPPASPQPTRTVCLFYIYGSISVLHCSSVSSLNATYE